MNILLTILLVVAIVIAAILIIGLFTAKSYVIERQIQIHRPAQEVFNYIRYLKNQDHFNKWVMMDPAMQKQFSGIDGRPGFIYAWSGNKKAGAGEQEIKGIIEGTSIDIEIRFQRPFKGVASAYLETGSVYNPKTGTESTQLRWIFGSRLTYPMNIILLFMNTDKTLGADIETSLRNVKYILEGSSENKTLTRNDLVKGELQD